MSNLDTVNDNVVFDGSDMVQKQKERKDPKMFFVNFEIPQVLYQSIHLDFGGIFMHKKLADSNNWEKEYDDVGKFFNW